MRIRGSLLHMEGDAVVVGDFEDLRHVRRGRVWAYRFQILFKATGRDEDHDSPEGGSHIAKGVDAAALAVGDFAGWQAAPLALAENFKVALEDGEGLFFVLVAVGRWAAAGWDVLNDGGGYSVGGYGVDENVDAFPKDFEGFQRGHSCSVGLGWVALPCEATILTNEVDEIEKLRSTSCGRLPRVLDFR